MIKDDGQTRGPRVTRTGASAARRRPTTAGAEARAGRPLATSSTLPLFPSASDEHPQEQLRPRAPLGVRRPTPAVPRVRVQAPRQLLEPRLSFENAQPVAAQARPTRRPAVPLVRLAAGLFDTVLLVSLDAIVIVLTLRLAELDLQSLDTLPVAPLAGFLTLAQWRVCRRPHLCRWADIRQDGVRDACGGQGRAPRDDLDRPGAGARVSGIGAAARSGGRLDVPRR